MSKLLNGCRDNQAIDVCTVERASVSKNKHQSGFCIDRFMAHQSIAQTVRVKIHKQLVQRQFLEDLSHVCVAGQRTGQSKPKCASAR